MKTLFVLLIAAFSLQAFAGTKFYRIEDKVLSDGTEGYEIRYNAETKKCIKEFWDGSRSERASKEISVRNCKEFIAGLERKEKNNGECKEQSKLVDIKTLIGITAKEELKLSKDCYCYSSIYIVGGHNDTKEFVNIKKCIKEFGEI